MDIESILAALERNDGSFPRAALEAAIAQRESITPHLLEVLRFARTHVEELPEGYWLHTLAMFLLAQFRETRAYPLVVDLLDLPKERLEDLHGDGITEDMNRILASVCGGDTSLIEWLVEKPDADEYVRDAAVGALVTLVVIGQRTREETLGYFRHLFQTATADPDSFFWSGLVSRASELYPDLVYTEIQEAYARELPDPCFIALEDVDETLARGKDATLAALPGKCHYRLIDDTLSEIEWWACFQPTPPPRILPEAVRSLSSALPAMPTVAWSLPQPAVVGVQPGRNDRCPCGSGLKFKKCCLKRNAS